jgi:osmotically-inducible protein OsmY
LKAGRTTTLHAAFKRILSQTKNAEQTWERSSFCTFPFHQLARGSVENAGICLFSKEKGKFCLVHSVSAPRPLGRAIARMDVEGRTMKMTGCTKASEKSPDVAGAVRQSLDQANLNDISVSQDRDKGIVTLTGHVPSDDAKNQAENIAKSAAAGQVVADEIAVVPPDDAKIAKTVNSDIDKGIEKDLDATLVANRLNRFVKYDVKNRVVTLTGALDSQGERAHAAKLAAGVPNVSQVVNEIQVKDQKATSN